MSSLDIEFRFINIDVKIRSLEYYENFLNVLLILLKGTILDKDIIKINVGDFT